MELRIMTNDSTEQLTDIGRDQLCDFQNGIQYKFPYFVCNGQLERFIFDLSKNFSDGFIGFKSLHGTEDVILHQC